MLDWVKKVDSILADLNKRSQIKRVRSLPVALIEKELQSLFQDNTLTLTCAEKGWVKREENPLLQKQCYVILLPPLKEPLFVSLDKNLLLGVFLPSPISFSEEITEGFVAYLFAEIMLKIHTTQSLSPLGMQLQDDTVALDQESYFQIDLTLSTQKGKLWAALLLSSAFQEAWNHYFINEPLPPLTEEEEKKIDVELGVQLGEATLSLKELQSLQKGDFLLLDNCLYDPKTKKGSLLITLQEQPIFRVKLKNGTLKLVDYPRYEEVHPMNGDEDFYDDEEIEEEEDAFTEDESDALEAEEEGEEELGEQLGKRSELPEVSIEEVDVNVVVEVCRVRMSAKELLGLTTGKVLDLDLSLEQAVDLVVNGKRFGRAELMRVGDNLGVRILQLVGK